MDLLKGIFSTSSSKPTFSNNFPKNKILEKLKRKPAKSQNFFNKKSDSESISTSILNSTLEFIDNREIANGIVCEVIEKSIIPEPKIETLVMQILEEIVDKISVEKSHQITDTHNEDSDMLEINKDVSKKEPLTVEKGRGIYSCI